MYNNKYAKEALEVYNKMLAFQIKPDIDSFIHVTKATAKLGDINFANNCMILMKDLKYEINKYVINNLIKTYATACSLPDTNYEYKEQYIEDAWRLFNIIVSNNEVNIHILNTMLELHVKSELIEKIEEIVMPLYKNYNVEYDKFTYDFLLQAYLDKRILAPCVKIYNELKNKHDDSMFTRNFLNNMLDVFMRLRNLEGLVEIIQKFQSLKIEPKKNLLRKISRIHNLPDELYYLLSKFKNTYGFIEKKELSKTNFKQPKKHN